jgi:hypothetical protein
LREALDGTIGWGATVDVVTLTEANNGQRIEFRQGDAVDG